MMVAEDFSPRRGGLWTRVAERRPIATIPFAQIRCLSAGPRPFLSRDPFPAPTTPSKSERRKKDQSHGCAIIHDEMPGRAQPAGSDRLALALPVARPQISLAPGRRLARSHVALILFCATRCLPAQVGVLATVTCEPDFLKRSKALEKALDALKGKF